MNTMIRTAFEEEEIYRIDHYLGKEMVQNIEVIRFSNALFEPLWNNRYISNIQITSSETLGVEERGRYYDKSGALRDMVQNHMLQMVALLAMEPPIRLTTEEIRSEKVRVLRAGVPFYIRTGKRMATKSTKIVVQFKDIPMNLYYQPKETLNPNLLVIHIQPDEGITLHLNVKKSGQKEETKPIHLHFSNQSVNGINTPEAYERLIFDSMRGDATNFTHWEEVALSWKFVDRISQVWENTREQDFPNYISGSMGPKKADELLEKDHHIWWPIEQFEIN